MEVKSRTRNERERERVNEQTTRARERETRKDHGGIHGRWDETGWDEMIVLHVARARTDSINIRGSLGKTWAALWITSATFLYFSGCNAHTPFTLFSFLRLYSCRFHRITSLSRSFFTRPSSLPVSLFYPHAMPLLFSPVRIRHRLFRRSLSLFHSWPVSTYDSLYWNRWRLVTLELFPRPELLFSRPKWKLFRLPYSRNWASG